MTAELVDLSWDRYHAVPEAFRDALAKPGADPLEALFSHGRLVAIPRSGKLRQALLAQLAEKSELGRLYSERDVRERLVPVHDDHAPPARRRRPAGAQRRRRYLRAPRRGAV